MIPSIRVFPYRLLDGGHLLLRARVMLNLVALVPGCPPVALEEQLIRRELVVNLTDLPQRAAFREQVVALRRTANEAQVAQMLGLTVTAAQRAAALQRKMDAMGVDTPYVPLREPPEDYAKLRRHRHKRYRFEPLPGYEEPQFP